MTSVLCDVTPVWWSHHWPTRKQRRSGALIARALATLTCLGDQVEAITTTPEGIEVRLMVQGDAEAMAQHGRTIRDVLDRLAEEAPATLVWN